MIPVSITNCGPLGKTSLELPDHGIVLILGPNLSGKSLLINSIASYYLASAIVNVNNKFFGGALMDRLLDPEWSELFGECLDPLEYLSSEIPYEDVSDYEVKLDEIISRGLNITLRQYLASTITTTELCLSRGIDPWVQDRQAFINIELGLDTKYLIRISMPPLDPKKWGSQILIRQAYVIPKDNPEYLGLVINSPLTFINKYYAQHEIEKHNPRSYSLSAILTSIIKHKYKFEKKSKFKELISLAWKEISGVEPKKFEILEEENQYVIVINNHKYPWNMTSYGIMNLLAQELLIDILPWFKLIEVKPLIAIEEPEVSLDPYTVYLLACKYCELVKEYDALLLISTHSEILVKGLEDALREEKIKPNHVRVYETMKGEKSLFTLKKCEVSDKGIAASRLIRIAEKIIIRSQKILR
ncbi:MAG: hypothetical protein DRJ60_02910 [Thermoprotei archaeon]|nr:MAG: hypothetical protein DRJ60_02910 [Thermoprotei archaeon]